MLVIRDALLLQLQKDRLRQEIIMAELANLESAMALRSAARTAYVEQPKPLFFTFNEEFMPYFRWTEHCSNVDGVHDPKKKDVRLTSPAPPPSPSAHTWPGQLSSSAHVARHPSRCGRPPARRVSVRRVRRDGWGRW